MISARGPRSVLISAKYFPPQIGGISRIMWEVARALGPAEICVVTGVRADAPSSAVESGVRVYRRPLAFAQESAWQALNLALATAEIAIRERPAVAQLATCEEGYVGLHLDRLFGLPFVIYAHGNEILAAQVGQWQKPRLALQRASRVIANSHFTAGLLRNIGVEPGRIEVVHPGCDITHYRQTMPRPGLRERLLGERTGPTLLTVGHLVERKGHDTVLKALPAVLRSVPDVTYLIIGDGPYRTDLERLAESLGVRRNVVFAGRVEAEILPECLAVCDAFIMTSRARLDLCDVEGFGLVYLEANACGKPVIGGRSGGIVDAVEHEFSGLLVDPLDVNEVAQAVIRILKDSDYARRLGEQGMLRVRREFTWQHMAERVRTVLSDVSREARSRPT